MSRGIAAGLTRFDGAGNGSGPQTVNTAGAIGATTMVPTPYFVSPDGTVTMTYMGLGLTGAKAEYPEKPITLILPLGAGGSHDRNARVFTSVIPSYLGNAVIVKLMPGASGQTGTAAAASANVRSSVD